MKKKIALAISILVITMSLSFTAGFIVSKNIQEKENNKNTIQPIAEKITFNLVLDGGYDGVGWFNYWGYNYDTTTGDLLTLKTITSDYNKLYSIIKKQVDNKLNEIKKENEIYSLTAKEIESLINQNGNWMFTETGIDIVFQKYDIADGATGAITVSIDKSLINDLLKDKYKF